LLATAPGFGAYLPRFREEDFRLRIPKLIETDKTLTQISTDAVTGADIRAGRVNVAERTELTNERTSVILKAALAAIHEAE
jgi:hypothetical protein